MRKTEVRLLERKLGYSCSHCIKKKKKVDEPTYFSDSQETAQNQLYKPQQVILIPRDHSVSPQVRIRKPALVGSAKVVLLSAHQEWIYMLENCRINRLLHCFIFFLFRHESNLLNRNMLCESPGEEF